MVTGTHKHGDGINTDINETGTDWSERKLSNTLYLDQSVKIRVDLGVKRSKKTGRRFRQGFCLSLILFNLYKEGSLSSVWRLKIGHVISTVKYVDDFVLLAKEGRVIQGVIDRLTEIGKCHGMGMNV